VSELRWILLGAGVALILALWWWEVRKSRSAVQAGDEQPQPPDRLSPGAEQETPFARDGVDEVAVRYPPTIERVRVPRRPPVIEIPEDFEVDVSDFVTRDRRHTPEPAPRRDPKFGLEAETSESANAGETAFAADDLGDDHRAPWINTQPLERDEVAPKPEEYSEPSVMDPEQQRMAEASVQRIVALRLVATGSPWPGRELRGAFEAEGLRFGAYSIFHRAREDGKPLLYVASMMEPGSFDLARMDEQEFSGISLFGVVPGPLDAPSTFDLALTMGRSLAERMKGQLQDEQGSTLTAQRILNLREELVHFEHRNRRLRRS
jgi:FtsZ-interacting cell division protein ZipA